MVNAQLRCKVGVGLKMLGRASRRWFCTSFPEGPFVEGPRPWLFVGLGNPGQKYQGTRHNVGFDMIDAFAESEGIPMDTVHCKALFGKGLVGKTPVFLAKPQTYMNLSGESSGPLAAYYKLPLSRVLLVKECYISLSRNREFARLRIGIGRPPGQMDPKAFLLQKFNATARERIDASLKEGVEMLRYLISKGLAESSRRFNNEQKYKHYNL